MRWRPVLQAPSLTPEDNVKTSYANPVLTFSGESARKGTTKPPDMEGDTMTGATVGLKASMTAPM